MAQNNEDKTKKPRRKSLRKEAVKTILEGDKTRITITLRPNGEPRTEIEILEKNIDKITFGSVSDGRNRLEACSYDKEYSQLAFVFLNGERIMVDKFMARKLMGLTSRMAHFFGITKHRKPKN
jgi:hypothetical protein